MSEAAKNPRQGPPNEVIGSSISDGVANQFKFREKLVSDRSKPKENLMF